MARGLSTCLTARVGAWDGPPVPTVLVYRRDLPWEVSLRFCNGENDGAGVRWVFARDLLAHGLRVPAGEGDVRVSPAGPALVRLGLHNGEVGVAIYLRHTAVDAFLRATTRLVPFGIEHRFFRLDSIYDALRRAT